MIKIRNYKGILFAFATISLCFSCSSPKKPDPGPDPEPHPEGTTKISLENVSNNDSQVVIKFKCEGKKLDINWGDDSPIEHANSTNFYEHTYEAFDKKSITIDGDSDGISFSDDGSTYTPDNATYITVIELGESNTHLTSECYVGMENLLLTSIPSSVENIGDSCFNNCDNLTLYCQDDSIQQSWGDNWNCSRPYYLGYSSFGEENDYLYAITNSGLHLAHYRNKDDETLSIPSIIDEQNVAYLDAYLFADLTNLTTIVFPSTEVTIGEACFQNCLNLGKVCIPINIAMVEKDAFKSTGTAPIYCETDDVSKWGSGWNGDHAYHLESCDGGEDKDFSYIVRTDNTVHLVKYNGNSPTVTIPTEVDGYTVTHLDSDLLKYYVSSVTIPEGITSIASGCFNGVTYPSEITLPTTITNIGVSAFPKGSYPIYCLGDEEQAGWEDGWNGPHSYYLGYQKTGENDDYKFIQCEDGVYITKNKKDLTETFTIDSQITYEGATKDVIGLGDGVFASQISIVKEFILPDTIKRIGNGCFAQWRYPISDGIPRIIIPLSVESMGHKVFDQAFEARIFCKADEAPSGWPDDWQGDGACYFGYEGSFSGDGYEYDIVKGGVRLSKYIGPDITTFDRTQVDGYDVVAIGEELFYDGDRYEPIQKLTHIVIAPTIYHIESYAFPAVEEEIFIPISVEAIDYWGFVGATTFLCQAEKQPETWGSQWGNNSPAIFDYISRGTTGDFDYLILGKGASITQYNGSETDTLDILTDIEGHHVVTLENSIFKDKTFIGVNLPQYLKYINSHCFENCPIKSVTLPNTVEQIEDAAFKGCGSLSSVNNLSSSIEEISDECFCDCSSLTSFTMRGNVKKIGEKAFYKCSSLKSVIMPDSITTIGEDCFYESGITSITLPKSLYVMKKKLFYRCVNLTSITIQSGVRGLEEKCLSATGITSLVIPDSVDYIGDEACAYCNNLTSVDLTNININSVPVCGTNSFGDFSNITFYVNSLDDVPFFIDKGWPQTATWAVK